MAMRWPDPDDPTIFDHPAFVERGARIDMAIDEDSITWGHWCPTCALPSAAEMRITWATLELDGVRTGTVGRYMYCTEHAGPIYDQERTGG